MPAMQNIVSINPEDIHAKAAEHFRRRHSLIEIRFEKEGGVLAYTFDKGLSVECLRLPVPESRRLESICDVYTFAGIFEKNLSTHLGVEFVTAGSYSIVPPPTTVSP